MIKNETKICLISYNFKKDNDNLIKNNLNPMKNIFTYIPAKTKCLLAVLVFATGILSIKSFARNGQIHEDKPAINWPLWNILKK